MASQAVLKALSVPVSYVPRSGPLVRRLAPHGGSVVRQRFRCGAVFDLDLSDRIQAESFMRRGYDRALCRWISRRLKPRDLFFDVGANVGLVSFSVATTGATVVAFEPHAENCEQWRRNRALNPSVNAEIVQSAVGAGSEPLRMRAVIPGESGWGLIQSDGEVVVSQTTLDAYTTQHEIERIDVLKVDVEGYEPAVLRGAEGLLSERRIGALVCELNEGLGAAAETVSVLARRGYRRVPISRIDSAFVL